MLKKAKKVRVRDFTGTPALPGRLSAVRAGARADPEGILYASRNKNLR
jgi:hypothetical protein